MRVVGIMHNESNRSKDNLFVELLLPLLQMTMGMFPAHT